jgi:hypothetical protein
MILIPMTAAALLMLQAASPAPKKAAPAAPKAAAAAPTKSTDVGVTVTYKGKGAVDASHKIIVFAFTDANITSGSRPIATEFASKNGETVAFKGVTSPIYVFAVYDEKGNYDGVSGPPPPGIPAATYSKTPKGPPTAVAPGTPVKFTFDDSARWNK